jgi:trk system potassium uptake protein
MRYRSHLFERYCALLGYIGQIFALIGGLHLVPLLLLAFYPDEIDQAAGFLLAGLPLITVGFVFWLYLRPDKTMSLTMQEGAVIIVIVWVTSILCSTVPFLFNTDLNFTQAVFEATSGWTTTGLSLVDVTETSHLILFFRSFIQLAGGAGFAIIAVSALTGAVGMSISLAEGRTDQLAPHVRQSASMVLRIYSGYIIFGIIALYLAGMNPFDAVNHAFTAVATGGFSTRPESIGYWDSPTIEVVVLILMVLGGTNFFTAYTFIQGKHRVAIRDGEIRLMTLLIVGVSTLLLLVVTSGVYVSFEKAVRVAIFETTSALTGTGFSTTTYHNWKDFGWLALTILMIVGGGSGSTAGGLKQFRVYILYKSVTWEVKRAFMPRHMINEPAIWHGEHRSLLNDRQVRQTALFIGLYVTVFLVGSGIMTVFGYPLKDSLFEFASTLGTVGLSVGITTPDIHPGILWIQSFAMLLGRLEFFAFLIGVMKIFSDIRTFFIRPSMA